MSRVLVVEDEYLYTHHIAGYRLTADWFALDAFHIREYGGLIVAHCENSTRVFCQNETDPIKKFVCATPTNSEFNSEGLYVVLNGKNEILVYK